MPVYPRVFKVRQLFDVKQVDDVAAAVDASLETLGLGEKMATGSGAALVCIVLSYSFAH